MTRYRAVLLLLPLFVPSRALADPCVPTEGLLAGIAASADGSVALVGHEDEIWVCNTTTWQRTRVLRAAGSARMAVTSDGELVAITGLLAGAAYVVKTANTEIVHQFPVEDFDATVAFSPDGSFLAVGEGSGVLTLWQVSNGERRWRTEIQGNILEIRFTPDGAGLVVGAVVAGVKTKKGLISKSVRLLNAVNGRTRCTTRKLDHSLYKLDMRADGLMMATASHQGTVELWELPTCKHHSTLLKSGGPGVALVRFAPRGNLLATVVIGGQPTIWDSSSGREIGWMSLDHSPIDLIFDARLANLAVLTNENRTKEFHGGAVGERHAGFRLYRLSVAGEMTPGQSN